MIHRLERAGQITRNAHPRDGRSTILRLTPTMEESATEAWAPLVAELDRLAQQLSESEREAVTRFLERAADAAERNADWPTTPRPAPTEPLHGPAPSAMGVADQRTRNDVSAVSLSASPRRSSS